MEKSIGTQIKILRELRGLSLDQLSNALGFVSKQSLSYYEQDKNLCPIDVLSNILDTLKGQMVLLNGEMIIDTIEEFERRKNLPNELGQGTPGAFWVTKDSALNEKISQDITKGIFNTMDTLSEVFDGVQHTGGGFFVGYKSFTVNNEDFVVIFGNDVVTLGKGVKNTYLTLEELLEIDNNPESEFAIKHSPYEYGNYHNLMEIVDEDTVVVEDIFLTFSKKIQKEIVRHFNLLEKYINRDLFVDFTTLDKEENTIKYI